MIDFFMKLQGPHWIAIGAILMILEMAVPGAVLIWFGIAGVLVGALDMLVGGLSPTFQFLFFSMFSLGGLFAYKKHFYKYFERGEEQFTGLHQRMVAMHDKEIVVYEDIVNGVGRAKVGDTTWIVMGKDCKEGTLVKVVGHESTALLVEEIAS